MSVLPLSQISTVLVFQVIQSIKLEILSHTDCSHLVQVVDPEQTDFLYKQGKLKLRESETFLIVPVLPNEKNLQRDDSKNTTKPPSYLFGTRFCRPCSLVFQQVSLSLVQQTSSETDDGDDDDDVDASEAPELLTVAFPGHPHNDFHVFLFQPSHSISDVLEFAKMTRKIDQAFYAIFEEETVLQIHSLSITGSKLVHLSTNRVGNSDSPLRLREEGANRLNFEGSSLVVKVCARCGNRIAQYLETGVFDDFIAGTVYELSLSVNATLELEAVLSLPANGLTEDGEWDDWALPLIEGTAAISTLMRHNTIVSKVIYFARPISHDSCSFVTAKPKIAKNPELLSRLVGPLDSEVWIATVVSMVILCLTLEVLFHYTVPNLHNEYVVLLLAELSGRLGAPKATKCFASSVIAAVVKPTLDQSPIASKLFDDELRLRLGGRLVLSCWLLALIVLGCGYRSKMTSLIVTPQYTKPPSTFKELADSNFKLFAVFWGGVIEKDFAAMNNEYSRKISERVTEYNYFDADCYLTIFKGDHACIGYNILFEELALGLMVDPYGQYMFRISKENLFPTTINFGISKYYPALVERVNFFIRTLDSNGVLSVWRDNKRQRNIILGSRTVKERIDRLPGLRSNLYDRDLDDNFPFLIVQLILFGATPAILIFCCEYLSPCLPWRIWRFLFCWVDPNAI